MEWDEAKNLANQLRHGISFEEATGLFAGSSDVLEIFDETHSDEEDRFISIGPVSRGLLLVVWTTPDDDTIRIISARWATRREHALYHRYREEGI